MIINLYQFRIECFFLPPPDCFEEWHGKEVHYETILASSAGVAARAIRKLVLKKIGHQRPRLESLTISDPLVIDKR